MRRPKETHGRTVHSATGGTTVRLIPNTTSEIGTETPTSRIKTNHPKRLAHQITSRDLIVKQT